MHGARALAVTLAGWLCGCAATEGPLLVATGDGEPPTAGVADAGSEGPGADIDAGDALVDVGTATNAGPVRPGMRLQYQLAGTLDTAVDVDFFVIDLEVDSAQVEALHARGRVVAAYISVGSHEPWRADADAFPEPALGEPLVSYPNERWLDIRDDTVRELQAARIERAADKGFDAVHLSALHGYLQTTGYPLTAADQLDYARFLAQRAHDAGLAVGLFNAWELGEPLAPAFDYAIHMNCVSRQRCAELDPFRALGRAVFDLETSGTPEEICPQAADLGLPVTLKRDSFDAWLYACP